MTLLKHLWRSERARHALIAAALAALLGSIDAFEPLRPLEWQLQAQVAPRAASGDIIFIEEREDPSSSANAQIREELAGLIDALSLAGARKIHLTQVFDRPSTAETDERLAQAIARSGRTVLTTHVLTTAPGEPVKSTLRQIAGSAPQAVSKQHLSPFGYLWFKPYSVVVEGARLPSLPAAIVGEPGAAGAEFPVDYTITDTSIPRFTSDRAAALLSSGEAARLFAGKTIVIGKGFTANDFLSIPGVQHVPPSIVSILAAETLKIGPPTMAGWLLPWLLASAALIIGVIACSGERSRRLAYVAIATMPIVLLFAFAHLRIFAEFGAALASLVFFAALRLWHLRQHRASLIDGISGLPSFRKLELDLAEHRSPQMPAVVVAKIHRFDEVLSSLSPEHHGLYVRLTADRLRIADQDLVIYSNGGRYLAWLQEVDDDEQLCAHLQGVRSMFSHPLDVSGTAVDVGITFGADATTEDDAGRKIAAAASAAERTTEAHTPVLLARKSSEADRLWNVSLQAKIDQALRSGEIYVVYQPQFDLRSGAMIGAEALVRWNDRQRGHISPGYFVEQCEQVGRMDALTKKVFREAITSLASSPLANTDFQLSINISAIMLHDLRAVEMLGDVLSSSPVSASRLTLEITETSRITDYDTARLVMTQLRELGVRLSIDDFGVGATSMETLLLLPFDELKIDRMFVSRVRDNTKARSIVESLVGLGRNLGITTIAEGVEDAETLATLRDLRCDAAQGYLLGRPGHLITLHHRSPATLGSGRKAATR